MKIFVAVLAVLAVTTYANAAVLPAADGLVIEQEQPTRLEDVDVDGGMDAGLSPLSLRERRFTCDLFSFSSKVATPNHAACAAKCIGKGRKGGSCHGTTCQCRGDKWVG